MIAAPAPENPTLHALHVVWRHKGKALLVFVLIVGLATAITSVLPRSYHSEGELLLRLGRENMALDPTATVVTPQLLTVQESRESEINSVIEILRSKVLLTKVVNELGPDVIMGQAEWRPAENKLAPESDVRSAAALLPAVDSKPVVPVELDQEGSADAPSTSTVDNSTADFSQQDVENAVRRLGKNLNVEAVKKSNVVLLTCDAPSPALAQVVVKRLIDYFLVDYIRLNRTPGSQEFLSQQTDAIRQKLQAKEEELLNLKDTTGLAEPEGRRTIVVNRIGRLEDELLETSAQLASTEAEVKQLRQQVDSLPATQITEQTVGFANDATDGMRQQLYALQIREQALAAKFTDDHPQLKEVRKQITDAKQVLDQEPHRTETKTGPSKSYEEIKVQLLKDEPVLVSLQAKTGQLKSQLASERSALEKLNADELQIASLQREVQLEEANYRKYVDSLEQARIDHAMAQEGKSNVSIVQPATLELKPVKPNVLQNTALAVVLGALAGIGLAFFCESWGKSSHISENGHAQMHEVALAR